MDIFGIGAVETAVMLGMVAGVVELVKRAFKRDWRAVAIIAASGVTGALTALCVAINPIIGAVVGFAASGFVTIAQNIGKNS